MDWHEEARLLAIWNLEDGVDVYRVDRDFIPLPRKVCLNIRRNYVIQVQFIDADTLVVGSDNGVVLIVNLTSLSVVMKLNHENFGEQLDATLVYRYLRRCSCQCGSDSGCESCKCLLCL